jgi:phosphoribosylamine--glycine ligase
MNILIIGSGGREHTLAWKIKQSPLCDQLFIAPGNAGTAAFGTNLPIAITDFEELATSALANKVELIIVGPEEPLVKGIADYFISDESLKHINLIGPSAEAAKLEGSKSFAKAFMNTHGIPTAAYAEFTRDNYEEGIAYIRGHALPIVLKADGLAAGKGVLICNSHLEALAEFELMLVQSKFGDAGRKVVVEAFLQGIEVSVFALTDGEQFVILPEAKDYKRIGDGDKGLNTGGMGAVSPVPFFDEALRKRINDKIILPTIMGIKKDKMAYKGFIFFGLMVNNGDPFVIEYNCRLGDPETEVVIPRLKNDLVAMFVAAGAQQLNSIVVDINPQPAVTTIAVSGGYPGDYEKGKLINGLSTTPLKDTIVFHAGTLQQGNEVLTNGGRVLAVTAFADNILEASELSLYMMEQISFEGINYRKDIGYEFK